MPVFTLREWETLPIGDENGCIPAHIAERLDLVAKCSEFSRTSGRGVLEMRRHDLRARGIVGVLAINGSSLEILPKIDVEQSAVDGANNASIRKRLVQMLAVALNLKLETGQLANLDFQRETLLEILIRIFCEKLQNAVRCGMPRKYIVHAENLRALRGSLDVTRQFTVNAVNPSRLACKFDELSEDIAINRIIKATIVHLNQLSCSANNQQSLRTLAFLYADVSQIPPNLLQWDDVVIDRTNQAWQEVFGMAKLFLRNCFQTTSHGPTGGTSLLFEMNALFEEYIGRMLMRAFAGTDYSIKLQGGRLYCLTSTEDQRNLFQTKPDILITRAGQIVHVIDTKWKWISSRIEDRKQGVSQSDVYQMMAYAQLYKAPKLTLLYPHHRNLVANEGVQNQFYISGLDSVLETASIDISSGDNILGRLKRLVNFDPSHLTV